MTLQAKKVTFGGTEEIRVGKTRFGIPRGSRFVHVKKGNRQLAYVLDLNGKEIHCLVPEGEVPIPPHLQRLLLTKIFGITLAQQLNGENALPKKNSGRPELQPSMRALHRARAGSTRRRIPGPLGSFLRLGPG
ncbi:hypothetical protein BH09ACT5_BH09ACT5_01230 [soil metagenome]